MLLRNFGIPVGFHVPDRDRVFPDHSPVIETFLAGITDQTEILVSLV